jgi:hypothetical protein
VVQQLEVRGNMVEVARSGVFTEVQKFGTNPKCSDLRTHVQILESFHNFIIR